MCLLHVAPGGFIVEGTEFGKPVRSDICVFRWGDGLEQLRNFYTVSNAFHCTISHINSVTSVLVNIISLSRCLSHYLVFHMSSFTALML